MILISLLEFDLLCWNLSGLLLIALFLWILLLSGDLLLYLEFVFGIGIIFFLFTFFLIYSVATLLFILLALGFIFIWGFNFLEVVDILISLLLISSESPGIK